MLERGGKKGDNRTAEKTSKNIDRTRGFPAGNQTKKQNVMETLSRTSLSQFKRNSPHQHQTLE